jgi:hypothetical protein
MDDELILDVREVRSNGSVYFRRRYKSGLGIEGVYLPEEPEPPAAERTSPLEMGRLSTSQINRLCCEADGEADRAYLEGRWDEAHGR